MSLLKKIGQIVNAASQFVPIYGPLIRAVTAAIPGDKDDRVVNAALLAGQDGLMVAAKLVLDAEIMGQAIGAPGAQKALMMAPAMHQLMMDIPLLKGKKPKDAAVAKEKAAALGGALADYLNCYED